MNLCFIINEWKEIEPEKETSIRLIHEACVRKHRVAILYSHNLTIRNNIAYGFARVIEPMDSVPDKIEVFFRKVRFREHLVPLTGFDAIFIRKDPPIDNIMLNFLDSVKDDTFIINSIDGIRKGNNKLYTTTFHDPGNIFLPVTYVSKNKDFLLRIIDETPFEKLILKPLDAYGGSGVIVLEKSAPRNIRSLLDFYISGSSSRNYVILQQFVEGAEDGDIRVLMLNGQAIGAYKRVPAAGDVRSNIHAGGEAVRHVLTENQRRVCQMIGPKLVSDGLYFCGVDLINDHLIEVNVLSPGGITNINRLNRTRLQRKVLDFIEEKVLEHEKLNREKQSAINRKMAFREELSDAADGR